MKIIEQSWEWLQKPVAPLKLIELAGRTCYKSEAKITATSAEKFVKMLLNSHHDSVIEHAVASVRFITSRSITHELVRHRLCSFSQESTRYVRYSGAIEFIQPVWWNDPAYPEANKQLWHAAMQQAEDNYLRALTLGDRPEQARELLPHALKTEIVVTANLREWRHLLKVRSAQAAHPQMRALMRSCSQGFAAEIPAIFDDLLLSSNPKELQPR